MCVASVYDLILRPPLVVYPGGLTSSLDFNRTVTNYQPTQLLALDILILIPLLLLDKLKFTNFHNNKTVYRLIWPLAGEYHNENSMYTPLKMLKSRIVP